MILSGVVVQGFSDGLFQGAGWASGQETRAELWAGRQQQEEGDLYFSPTQSSLSLTLYFCLFQI